MDFGVPNYSSPVLVSIASKMGLPLASQQALKLSNVVYLCSAALINIRAQFITEQIILYIRSFSVFLCWELSHHLHQVLQQQRQIPVSRAAFFEETGETYKKVVAACLRPLEQLTSNLSEVLEGCYVDKAYQLSNQFQLPTDTQLNSNYYESLNNFQKYAWCATAVASTERSHDEDSLGLHNSLVAILLLFQHLYLALLLLKW
uniref:Uncharacterized protein n=1 Tax=Salix viminalis TaxID=40686 RepID=A0A6N2K8U4_SALVM